MAEIRGYLVPHPPIIIDEIGKEELHNVANTRSALARVCEELVEFAPETILLSTPHNEFIVNRVGVLTGSKLRGDFGDFRFPHLRYEVETDTRLVSILLESKETKPYVVPVDSSELDHGALVFLDFLLDRGGSAKFVLLTATHGNPHFFYDFGSALRQVLSGGKSRYAYVASGDLSHCTKSSWGRVYHKEGPEFDALVGDAVRNCDATKLLSLDKSFLENAQQCGLYSFLICFGLFKGIRCTSEVLSYEDPFGVGYLVASFREL